MNYDFCQTFSVSDLVYVYIVFYGEKKKRFLGHMGCLAAIPRVATRKSVAPPILDVMS